MRRRKVVIGFPLLLAYMQWRNLETEHVLDLHRLNYTGSPTEGIVSTTKQFQASVRMKKVAAEVREGRGCVHRGGAAACNHGQSSTPLP
jgi:hypothetical protein